MAKFLIKTQAESADAEQITVKFRKSAVAGADPKKSVPLYRSALSFRAVNLPNTPGYDPGQQRHHLLPRQLLTKSCFGALFEGIGRQQLGFDDFRSNGMLLPACDAAVLRIGLPLHRGPHHDYNAMVIERVGQVEAHWSSVRLRSPQVALGDAVWGLRLLQRALRRRLLDAGCKRLALNRFDPLGHQTDFTQIDAMVDVLWPASDWAEGARVLVDQAPAIMAPIRAVEWAATRLGPDDVPRSVTSPRLLARGPGGGHSVPAVVPSKIAHP